MIAANGHENCAHAIDSGQNETVVTQGQVAKFGVIKNGDFSNDANDHSHAHARSDVEFGAGEPNSELRLSPHCDRRDLDDPKRKSHVWNFGLHDAGRPWFSRRPFSSNQTPNRS
jgi:hypothetical protein